jgi:SAM-dependent methyltransferase
MDSFMNFWDQQFSVPDFRYGQQPNRFLREQAVRLKTQSQVLLPGDGEGRNSVWLAGQGHHSTAMDSSSVGLEKAVSLAEQRGVSIAVIHADLVDWAPEPASYDAIVLTYVHLPAELRPLVHQRLAAALRPGGLFILEAFHPLQLDYLSGGPKAQAMLYSAGMIHADLHQLGVPTLEEIMAWEGEVLLDEGSAHQGLAYLTRYIAQRSSTLVNA